MNTKDVAIPLTVTQMIDARDQAKYLIETAHRAEKDAEKVCQTVGPYLYPSDYRASSLEKRIRSMDVSFWRKAFTVAGFFQVMDDEAMKAFDRDLDKPEAPEFTLDNIRATFLTMRSESDEVFRRGLVNVFKRLSKCYWTNNHDPFKIDKKVILTYITSCWNGLSVRYEASAKINDIDRVIKILDEKEHIPRSLTSAIDAAFKEDNIYEDDYYLIRGFKNGNMHITFKRADLIEKVNEIIAEWYSEGNALGSPR